MATNHQITEKGLEDANLKNSISEQTITESSIINTHIPISKDIFAVIIPVESFPSTDNNCILLKVKLSSGNSLYIVSFAHQCISNLTCDDAFSSSRINLLLIRSILLLKYSISTETCLLRETIITAKPRVWLMLIFIPEDKYGFPLS